MTDMGNIVMFGGFRRDSRGTIAVTAAIAVVPLMLALGVAIDYSSLAVTRTDLQAAADSAALTAAGIIACERVTDGSFFIGCGRVTEKSFSGVSEWPQSQQYSYLVSTTVPQ